MEALLKNIQWIITFGSQGNKSSSRIKGIYGLSPIYYQKCKNILLH